MIEHGTKWRTRQGQLIAVQDMSDAHLLNTVRCLRDMSPIRTQLNIADPLRREWLNVMANEVYARGLRLDTLTDSEPVHE